MDKQDIKLTDGRVIEIQVSFLTLYLIKNNNQIVVNVVIYKNLLTIIIVSV